MVPVRIPGLFLTTWVLENGLKQKLARLEFFPPRNLTPGLFVVLKLAQLSFDKQIAIRTSEINSLLILNQAIAIRFGNGLSPNTLIAFAFDLQP